MLYEILSIAVSLLLALYYWIKYNYEFWDRCNVPNIKPKFVFGNIRELALCRKSSAEIMTELYWNEMSNDEPIVGIYIFHKPAVLIRELELMKRILIKDFNCFSNRYLNADKHSDNLGAYNLKFVKNPLWKDIRSKLTPVFTSGKIKQMFQSINNIGNNFNESLCKLTNKSANGKCEIDLKELCALYTTDVIASFAFGIDANSIDNPNGEFRRNGRTIFVTTLYRKLEFIVLMFLPRLVSWFRVRVFNKKATQFIRSTIDYVMNTRLKTGQKRNDLIDILIDLRKETTHFNDDILIAQAAIFYIAGYEPTSTSLSMGLFELSKRPDVQMKLRQEIKEVLDKYNGQLCYEALNDMKYLNMVMMEILRLYPGLVFLERECTIDQISDYDPAGYSLAPYSDFYIPNGMPVYIPIYALHRDPKYFPRPNEFDPERFSDENKEKINLNAYMPFGRGPRSCIGERFGLIQTKIGLISVLRNHIVQSSAKLQNNIKLANTALLQCEGGIYCELIEKCL